MSLLMDALKRAEKARTDAASGAGEAPPPRATVQTLPPPRSSRPLLLAAGLAVLAAAGLALGSWWPWSHAAGIEPLAPNVAAAPPEPPPAAAAPEPPPVTLRPRVALPDAAPQAAPKPPAVPPAEPPASPIRIRSGTPEPEPATQRAYQAFAAGDLALARREYERALEREPKSAEALHGLAALALRQGLPEEAEGLYARMLEADPKSAAARAGLAAFRGRDDPVRSESRLKMALAEQPDSSVLHFALGNLYAQQGRWSEAQQAYSRAHAWESDNPDYQFNLAVSLEHLRQPRLALSHYRGALAAAAQRPASFDRDVAAGRVRELEQ